MSLPIPHIDTQSLVEKLMSKLDSELVRDCADRKGLYPLRPIMMIGKPMEIDAHMREMMAVSRANQNMRQIIVEPIQSKEEKADFNPLEHAVLDDLLEILIISAPPHLDDINMNSVLKPDPSKPYWRQGQRW